MPNKPRMAHFKKTSIQVDPADLDIVQSIYPELNMSEIVRMAIRMVIEHKPVKVAETPKFVLCAEVGELDGSFDMDRLANIYRNFPFGYKRGLTSESSGEAIRAALKEIRTSAMLTNPEEAKQEADKQIRTFTSEDKFDQDELDDIAASEDEPGFRL